MSTSTINAATMSAAPASAATMSDTVWVVMRARNDMPLIEGSLAALADQDLPHRLLVMDNASTDGTRELAARHATRIIDIPQGAYVPGRVLNMAMAATDGPLVAFINSDCQAVDRHWLSRLLTGMADPAVAAAFGRQDPRPDCMPLMAKDTLLTFGDGSRQARWRHCFSMAASCIRRSTWQDMPFSESLKYSEDIDWTWRARQHGQRIQYVAEAAVLHSHNYTLRQLWKRQYGEGYAEAGIFDWNDFQSSLLRYSLLPWVRLVMSDAAWCLPRLHGASALASPVVRGVMAAGRRRGFLDARLDMPPKVPGEVAGGLGEVAGGLGEVAGGPGEVAGGLGEVAGGPGHG